MTVWLMKLSFLVLRTLPVHASSCQDRAQVYNENESADTKPFTWLHLDSFVAESSHVSFLQDCL